MRNSARVVVAATFPSSHVDQMGRLATVPEHFNWRVCSSSAVDIRQGGLIPGLHSILKHVGNIKVAQVFDLLKALTKIWRLMSINGAH